MKKLFAKFKDPKIIKPLILVVSIAILIGGTLLYEMVRSRIFIDNSLVDAPITTITPPSGGILTEIGVYEGERVKKGDAIAVVNGQTIYTDTDGLIIRADNQIGSSVTTQTTLIELINPSDMRI